MNAHLINNIINLASPKSVLAKEVIIGSSFDEMPHLEPITLIGQSIETKDSVHTGTMSTFIKISNSMAETLNKRYMLDLPISEGSVNVYFAKLTQEGFAGNKYSKIVQVDLETMNKSLYVKSSAIGLEDWRTATYNIDEVNFHLLDTLFGKLELPLESNNKLVFRFSLGANLLVKVVREDGTETEEIKYPHSIKGADIDYKYKELLENRVIAWSIVS